MIQMQHKDNVFVEFTDNNTVIVYCNENDILTKKKLLLKDFVEILNNSITEEKKESTLFKTSLLPFNNRVITVQYKLKENDREVFVLFRKNDHINFNYYDTNYENVGVPNLLFAIYLHKNIIQDIKVVAIKDKFVSEQTEIYRYPFSNVISHSNSVCLGGNRNYFYKEYELKSTSQLHSIPDMILTMPNNTDYYTSSNLSGMEYRPLLEYLQNNSFNNDWLVSLKMTYKDWFEKL